MAAQAHHPDKGGYRAAFERVQHAYRILIDPDKRRRYDETGAEDDGADNSGAMLMSVLVSALDRAVQASQGAFETFDLVGAMRQLISKDISDAQALIPKINKTIADIGKIRSRLEYRGDGVSALDGVLASRLQGAERNLAGIPGRIALLRRAEEQVAHYVYSVDHPEADIGLLPPSPAVPTTE